jgi:molybdenum cofactor biosynthesis protein A
MNNARIIPIARMVRTTLPPGRDLAAPPEGELVDRRGRRVRDLRISVTDRCNFRCVYCMPKEVFDDDYAFLPRKQLLSFEEIVRVAKIFVDQGVEKIRITGGEPLLRRHLENLIEQLARLPVEITLTTNGSLLAKKARALKDAGLHRVTVSLDGMDDAVFKRMNDVDFPVGDVLDGIAAAAAAGLAPVKVNCAVKRGTNDDQILPLARHFRHSGHILRFIEYMDVGSSNGWRMDEVLPSAEVLARIHAEFPPGSHRRQLPRRSRRALALSGRRRRNRCHLLGDTGLLFQLHAHPPVHRRPALHLPLRPERPRPARAAAPRRRRRGAAARDRRRLARPRRPLFRDPHRRHGSLGAKQVEMSYIGG